VLTGTERILFVRLKELSMIKFSSRILCVVALLIPTFVFSSTISGVVRSSEGSVVSGALLTLVARDGLYSETVYSDKHGRFAMVSTQHGVLTLRARKAYFADSTLSVESEKQLTIILQKLSSESEISDQLSASAHFTNIHFDDPQARKFFQVDCISCHQLGNSFTRRPRSTEYWQSIVRRMLGFWGVTDEKWIKQYASVLKAGFDGNPAVSRQQHNVDPLAQKARVQEWKLPDGLISHDVEFHEADGKFYTVDQNADRIYITDPTLNTTETFNLPEMGLPQGGKFFTVFGDANPMGLSIRHGPHSLQEGPNGHFYTTNAIGGQIGEFDPAKKTYATFEVGGKAMYPHTLRFDGQGQIWFTITMSNQLGRFNPNSGEMTLLDLPATSVRPEVPVFTPYGIDVSPVDGSIWYSRLHANKIGRVDAKTLEIQEFEPPLTGPRRLRFDAVGMLWIPAFGDGSIVRLNPTTMEYTTYALPTLADNEIEAPYAVAVHPETQEVWVTANMSDRVFRFFPKEERFVSYPLPTRGTYMRDIIFLPDGRVCGASSPVPAVAVVEDGMQAIICIEPNDE